LAAPNVTALVSAMVRATGGRVTTRKEIIFPQLLCTPRTQCKPNCQPIAPLSLSTPFLQDLSTNLLQGRVATRALNASAASSEETSLGLTGRVRWGAGRLE
jgi:hypothetical protein